ncbi:hypothetical protein NP233_g4153 [Leucocoprinus birnbaumii]|uniref:Protein kinase domain-containing protein n=1 Tax=Leucocoprinus birnbaumii TaxID=56174 RepID=A0AAD5YXF4_9AGAR|nr:hypothetical protein NP233_g4153 [Leucocoprinus birnbaumii]
MCFNTIFGKKRGRRDDAGFSQVLSQESSNKTMQVTVQSLDLPKLHTLLERDYTRLKQGHFPHHWRFLRRIDFDKASLPFVTTDNMELHEGTLRDQSKVVVAIPHGSYDEHIAQHARDIVLRSHIQHPKILPIIGVYCLHPQEIGAVMESFTPQQELHNYAKISDLSTRLSFVSEEIEEYSNRIRLKLTDSFEEYWKDSSIYTTRGSLMEISGVQAYSLMKRIAPLFQILRSAYIPGGDSDKLLPITPSASSTRWAAPERVAVDHTVDPSLQSDIWSVGCLICEVLFGAIPFSRLATSGQVIYALQMKCLPYEDLNIRNRHPALKDTFWEVVRACWDQNPHRRPSCNELLSALSQ